MTALMAVRALLRIPAATWGPGDLGASLDAWYDVKDATYVVKGGSPESVSQLTDRSGNARHATNGIFVNQPRWNGFGRGGYADFLGGNDWLDLPAAISFSTTSRCVAAVHYVNSAEADNQTLIGPNGNNAFAFFLAGAGTGGDRCGITASNVSFFAQGPLMTGKKDAFRVFLGNLTSSTWRVSLDGTAVTGSHSRTFTANRTGFIGKEIIAFGGEYDWLNGSLAELVICSELSEANQQRLEGYLAWRWGLEGNLPNDHPWKTTAP